MTWKMVPIEPTDEMKRALFVNLANADNEADVIKAVMAAAPSPWIPLDPAAPGHRMPTESDLSPQGAISVWELGKERVVHISRFEHQLDQRKRRVLWIESGSWTHWAPCRSGPEEDK